MSKYAGYDSVGPQKPAGSSVCLREPKRFPSSPCLEGTTVRMREGRAVVAAIKATPATATSEIATRAMVRELQSQAPLAIRKQSAKSHQLNITKAGLHPVK